jgi:hypothetical protein
MKTPLKKIITVGLVATMPLTLTACDESGDDDTSSDGVESTTTTDLVDTTLLDTTVPG